MKQVLAAIVAHVPLKLQPEVDDLIAQAAYESFRVWSNDNDVEKINVPTIDSSDSESYLAQVAWSKGPFANFASFDECTLLLRLFLLRSGAVIVVECVVCE
jgi:hypothetical protein